MKTIKRISTMLVVIFSIISYTGQAQNCNNGKILDHKQFDLRTLESKWDTYVKNPGFKALLEEVKSQGFTRIEKNDKTAWGFKADFVSDAELGTSPQEAEVCAFDFYKKTPGGGQLCSMLWRKVGGTIYKAYIIFPEGEKDAARSFEKSIEYYADENNKIQRAHSFGKCWAKCIFKRFSATNCAGAIVACGAAAAGLTALGLGITTPVALGIFGACAGIACLYPLAICAAYCL